MSSGITGDTPREVQVELAKPSVELERGDIKYADTYFLAKLVLYGNDNEKLVAGDEWRRRTGKDFPYHPSFEDDKYPMENLKEHGGQDE